jgi:2-oxoglutarate dehydrogenase E1 component
MNTYSLDYIDDLYVQYIKDPASVSPVWRRYFEEFSLAAQNENSTDVDASATDGSSLQASSQQSQSDIATKEALWLAKMQDRVDQLVREYRVRGHLMAQLDPLGMARQQPPELNPESHGLTQADLTRPFTCTALQYVNGSTLGDILQKLRNTYCRSIGAQFTHIDNRNVRDWLQRRMESTENRLELSRDVQKRIYSSLADATIFEEFIRKQFVGAKTFSLEGAESLIPLLDRTLEKAGQHEVKEVVIAMAHRGRMNVLANILKKRVENIFWSFDDPQPEVNRGGGDVRYHMGYSSDWKTSTGAMVHISLCFNPSHLEFVNPVALGRCRAKQDHQKDTRRSQVMTLLIHGDASFAGEGVVQETLNLSQLAGYSTGGTVHVIVNNQIGFTTEPEEGRSSTYATDVAKMLQIPIFHVNGEDPEAVAQVVNLAMDFRKEFHRDVVIDMYAYRRLGHNEGDEPRFTQPLMYQAIDSKKSVRESYLERLLQMEGMTREEADKIATERHNKLSKDFAAHKNETYVSDIQTLGGLWKGYFGGPEPETSDIQTSLSTERANELLKKLVTFPQGFSLNKKLQRVFEQRSEMAEGKRPVDWASAELLAFAATAADGRRVRLSGQDCERGTFSQRHAVLRDSVNNNKYMPLAHLSSNQGQVEIINSPLSEAGVLGFEYGYSLDCPKSLIAWEAQFGDFWNVAQVIVDQFISSAEDKWKRLSQLIMLLPHGFEGQGPEHCSARLERFLQMCAEHNIQVTQPSTPAQYFHLLRRQVIWKWAKPLIVLTPKSLLRHPLVVSPLADFCSGSFEKIIPDNRPAGSPTKRVLLCSGKAYYELFEERQRRNASQVALVRIEQYYPLSSQTLMNALSQYADGTEVIWFQEEPANMGAWHFMKVHFVDDLSRRFKVRAITRAESASPSTGSLRAHKLEHDELIEAAFHQI